MSKATFVEQAINPSTPAAGRVTLFAKDNDFYSIDDLGVVKNLADTTDASAIHVNVAGEIVGIASKALPVAADTLVCEDSASGDAKKSILIGTITIESLRTATTDVTQFLAASGGNAAGFRAIATTDIPDGSDGTAIHTNVAGEIAGITDADIALADRVVFEDASDGNNKKSDTVQGIIDLAPTKSMVAFGDYTVGTTTTTRYLGAGILDAGDSHVTELFYEAVYAGTVRNLRVSHTDVGVGGATITYTVRKNSSDQTLLVAITAATAGGSDTSNSFTVAAGDKISIKVTKSGTITSSPTHVTATVEVRAT